MNIKLMSLLVFHAFPGLGMWASASYLLAFHVITNSAQQHERNPEKGKRGWCVDAGREFLALPFPM